MRDVPDLVTQEPTVLAKSLDSPPRRVAPSMTIGIAAVKNVPVLQAAALSCAGQAAAARWPSAEEQPAAARKNKAPRTESR